MAPEGDQLKDTGLPADFVQTILSTRASTSKTIYALKWGVFERLHCTRIVSVLELLQGKMISMPRYSGYLLPPYQLAITSLKRTGDLQALSILPSCLDSTPALVKAILYPYLDYILKVALSTLPVILEAFCLTPFTTLE